MISRLLLFFSCLIFSVITQAQITRVQFINNCADKAYPGLDIYINGQLSLPPDVNDLFFRQSTPFLNLTAGTSVEIAVASNNSNSLTDTFYRTNITLSSTNNYIIVAEGIKSTSGYNPAKPFALKIYNQAKDAAPLGQVNALFLNGATDAPSMDIRTGITTMADDISYGDFSGYTLLPGTTDQKFRITTTNGSVITHNYDADFSTFSVSGKAITVITSGFLNPGNNSNGDTFGLWMSVPDGGPLTELTASSIYEPLARIQLIHNSADTGVGKIDVYVDNQKVIDTLDYLHATAYGDAFAKTTNIRLVRSGTMTQLLDTNITLDSGKVYNTILHGISSDTNYKPLPPLKLAVYKNARENAANSSGTDILLMHGCTDAAVSSVKDISQSAIPPFTNLNYGDFSSGYHSITFKEGLYVDTGSNHAALDKYEFNINNLNTKGAAVTVVYAGFITPDSNSNGPSFGLWVAMPSGGALTKLPNLFVSVNEITKPAQSIRLWPNPATNMLSFDFNKEQTANIIVSDMSGRIVLAQPNHQSNNMYIGQLPAGNYVFLMQTMDGVIYRSKFTKK